MQPQNTPFGPEMDRQDESPIIGQILLGRFLVERDLTDPSLGGGFRVLRIKDLKEYCREAVLKISATGTDLESDGPSFTDVAGTVQKVSHPNIEEFLEAGSFPDGQAYVLTPLYPGTRLDKLVAPDRRLELNGIADLVAQLSDALGVVHDQGILHCDIRPANILVPEGEIGANPIRLINFGTAWPVDSRGERLSRVQPGGESLHYAAPELLVALGHRSPASDVYSLSVLVYRLVTGTLPFAGRECAELLNAINIGRPDAPGNARTDLRDETARLIMSGLQFEPLLRPQNIRDFGLRLFRSLQPPRGILIQAPEPLKEPEAAPEPPAQAREPIESDPAPPVASFAEPLPIEEETGAGRSAPPDLRRAPVSDRAVAWTLIVLLMAGALSIPVAQTLLKDNTKAAPIEPISVPARSKEVLHNLRYRVETLAQAGPVGTDPHRQLTFSADSPGHAYVLGESAAADGRPAYQVLYPVPGLSREHNEYATVRLPSAGFVWIVWLPAADSDLDAMLASAQGGSITDDEIRRRLRHFLERNRGHRLVENTDASSGYSVLTGERIVFRLVADEAAPRSSPAGA